MTAGWQRVPLRCVLRRSAETELPRTDAQYREITVRLWGKGVVERRVVSGAEIAGGRRFVARTAQLIVSRIDARNGAIGVVPPSLDGALVTNDFPLFDVAIDRLELKFLEWLTKTEGFVELCRRASEGTTNRVRLQEETFLGLEVGLPPLEEQRRIVGRISECSASLAEASRMRREAAEMTIALRHSCLRDALLQGGGEKRQLEDVCEAIIDNLHSNPKYSAQGVPCVRSPDVGWGTLHLGTALRTSEEEYRRRTVRGEPRAGDIVLVREGGGTGKCAIVSAADRFSLGQRVMMLRAKSHVIEPQYFLYQLLSPLVQDQINTTGSASPHLNIGALRRFEIRVPSLQVQRATVASLNRQQGRLDSIKHQQAHTGAELNALLPSILDRAFRGEL